MFAGFWPSYALLVLGRTHHWFGVTPEAAVDAQGSSGTLNLAGIVVFAVAAVGVYLFFSSASQSTRGARANC